MPGFYPAFLTVMGRPPISRWATSSPQGYLFDKFSRFGYRGFRVALCEKAAEELATRRVTRWLNDQIGEARALLERR
jgi:hypothetical protein